MTQPLVFPNPEDQNDTGFENFDLIFEQYAPCLYGIILRAVNGNVSLAETLTGQAFVRIHQNSNLYVPARQRMLTWMSVIVVQLLKEQGYHYNTTYLAAKRTVPDPPPLNLFVITL